VEASVPKDNVKGEDRFFFPRPDSVECDNNKHECRIGFEYRPPTEQEIISYRRADTARKPDQDKILLDKLPALLKKLPDAELRRRLSADTRTEEQIRDNKPAEPVPLLLKRLRHFVKRSTTDYFVHKNLRRFLHEELEFYVKDQVLHLGDIEGDIQARLRMLKVLRRLAEQIIEFLSQIEDAQKRLFEKRKFVTETSWLIPIQNVPESFWPDVVGKEAQRQQWRDWLAVEPDEFFGKKGKVDLSFLKSHPTLAVDTRLFPADWTRRLLEALPFTDLDEATDGLMVCSENYQALRLASERLHGKVMCVYADPPYNTGQGDFVYKDGYRHSSWLAMVDQTLNATRGLLGSDYLLAVSVDQREHPRLRLHMQATLPGKFIADIANVNNPQGRSDDEYIATAHEFLVMHGGDDCRTRGWKVEEKELRRYRLSDGPRKYREVDLRKTGKGDRRVDRENLYYYFYYNLTTKHFFASRDESGPAGSIRIAPTRKDGTPGRWRWELPFAQEHLGLLVAKKMKARDAWTVYEKDYLEPDERVKPPSVWNRKTYNSHYASDRFKDLGFTAQDFEHPKPVDLLQDYLVLLPDSSFTVLDAFAGAGTTGHAAINLNRADGGHRKFTLVEMGEQFDSVMVPRIVKVMYSPEWKGGRPARMATKDEAERTPRLVKVLRLESYEDALHNVASPVTQARAGKREQAHRAAAGEETFRIKYLVSLPLEASDTMLSLEKLEYPFGYTLEILTDDGPTQKQTDLVETFNYLYGLRVKRYETWQHDGREYRVVKATDREQKRRILVLWRDMAGLKPKEEREFLEAKLKELAAAGEAYDEKLINGDCAVPGIASLDPLFKQLMTAGEDEAG